METDPPNNIDNTCSKEIQYEILFVLSDSKHHKDDLERPKKSKCVVQYCECLNYIAL